MLLLAGLSLGIPGLAVGTPSVTIDTQYYSVYGLDIADIYQSLQQNGPNGDRGRSYHAHTEWDIQWGYRWIESEPQCRLTQVEVSIKVSYLLPQLVTLNQLDPSTRQSWDRFYTALLKHEEHHKDYGIKAAEELEQLLLAQPPQACFGFKNRLSEAARGVIEKYDAMEKAYDQQTDHGIREGVILQ